MFAVVAATTESFTSSPCAVASTKPRVAASCVFTGSAKFVMVWLFYETEAVGAAISFNLLVLTPVSKSEIFV